MRNYRYAIPSRIVFALPLLAVVVTTALWISARRDYLTFLCPPVGACPANGWGEGWTDYTPASMQVAGMLSAPVAVFAAPLYHLVQQSTTVAELVVWLVAVAMLWSYVGYMLGTNGAYDSLKTPIRKTVGIVGCLFGILVLVGTPLYHVGILYWTATAVWLTLMFRHFGRLCFRTAHER